MPEGIPINITGGTYKHPSLPLSAQVTRNFWPQFIADGKVKSSYILQGFHGWSLFGTSATGVDRGMLEHKGVLYKVTGNTLYSVASDGTHTTLGTIPGTDRCILDGSSDSVVLTTGGVAYEWDGATLNTGSDPDFETPQSCANINSQVIYDGDGGRWCSSDVGAPLTINALNYATAEVEADDLLRVYTFAQTLYLLGQKTTETWYNTSVGNPPFTRIESGISPIGIQSIHSAANTEKFMYFLSNTNEIHRINGSFYESVSTLPLSQEIEGYSTKDDAIGFTMKLASQWFYVLTFPTENKTWVYPEGGEFFEWSSGNEGGRSRANSYAFAYGKHLVADYLNGNIYELSPTVYTENGETIIRVRDTAPIHGALFKQAGKRIEMNRFELIMETGVGLISGQGSNPEVILQYSDDGGRTFSRERRAKVGQLGQYQKLVYWTELGSFYERIIRIQVSDPVAWSIHSASADLEVIE